MLSLGLGERSAAKKVGCLFRAGFGLYPALSFRLTVFFLRIGFYCWWFLRFVAPTTVSREACFAIRWQISLTQHP